MIEMLCAVITYFEHQTTPFLNSYRFLRMGPNLII